MPIKLYAFTLVFALTTMSVEAIDASDRYRSPRNPERPVRQSTELIVLHTTEAAERGSLKKLSERGECHYCVTEAGEIYRIIDRDKEAFHAGRSMWNGKDNVDSFSIGIECVGYHDKAMTVVQLKAIRELVSELKSMYHLDDSKVVSHGHVAYGAPNKWHKKKHRGRKQCGMLFAMPSVRKELDLKSRPKFDPDVKAKRLVVGDTYLNSVLYGKVDTMTGIYGKPTEEKPKKEVAAKPKPVNAKGGKSAAKPATKTAPKGASSSSSKVAAQKNTSKSSSSSVGKMPTSIEELKKMGYKIKGTVSPYNTASKIIGARWNSADTFYTIRNKVIPGNLINPAKIEKGMQIWAK
ncbi:MAG: N-acetylmuramoyl-L-alanine amidase [Kiritimatiellae bacterium]|nr:N-acetylmuramoyl-L-alanine amidase [Kiritimatiellia bacterium]